MKLTQKIDDIICGYGRPCCHYTPHMHKRYTLLSQEQEIHRTILHAAVDTLFMSDNVGVIVRCMSDISSCCSWLLRYGTRKMTAIERKNLKKDGAKNE